MTRSRAFTPLTCLLKSPNPVCNVSSNVSYGAFRFFIQPIMFFFFRFKAESNSFFLTKIILGSRIPVDLLTTLILGSMIAVDFSTKRWVGFMISYDPGSKPLGSDLGSRSRDQPPCLLSILSHKMNVGTPCMCRYCVVCVCVNASI